MSFRRNGVYTPTFMTASNRRYLLVYINTDDGDQGSADRGPFPREFTITITIPFMSKRQLLRSLLALSIGMLLLYCFFNPLALYKESPNRTAYSWSFIATLLLMPKFILQKMNKKHVLDFCIFAHFVYMIGRLYAPLGTFDVFAVVEGCCAALLKVGSYAYLKSIAIQYSYHVEDTLEVTCSWFLGIFLFFTQSTRIWSSLFDLVENRGSSSLGLVQPCGLAYCPTPKNFTFSDDYLKAGLDDNTKLLSYALLFLGVSAIIVSALVDVVPTFDLGEESFASMFGSTVKALKSIDQLLLVPFLVFHGIEIGFFVGTLSEVYIECAWGSANMFYVLMCYGTLNSVTCLALGFLSRSVSRWTVAGMALFASVTYCIIISLWVPQETGIYLWYFAALLWGFGHAVWEVQLTSIHMLMEGSDEGTLSNFVLWQAIGVGLEKTYSELLCVNKQIVILLCSLLLGMLGYGLYEITKNPLKEEHPRQKSTNASIEEMPCEEFRSNLPMIQS